MKKFKKNPLLLSLIFTTLCIICIFCTSNLFSKPRASNIHDPSAYQIVISAQASPQEKKAADILDRYLDSITGVKLPVVTDAAQLSNNEIVIGNNSHLQKIDGSVRGTSLNDDGFVIKSVGSQLILWGKTPQADIYAAYHFLEKYMGCRKYSRYVTVIPKNKNLIFQSILDIENPVITYREVYYNELYDQEYKEWHKLDFFDSQQSKWGLWGHTYNQLIPANQYFQSHPEFFSLINNQRNNAQLCLSNQALIDTVINKVGVLIKNKPNAIYWSISQNDNEFYCQCDDCKRLDDQEGSHSASVLNFINKIAAHYPDKKFVMLAYKYSFFPPKTIKPLPNVIIEICPIDLSHNAPITSNNNPSGADVQKAVQGWRQKTNNLMVWDYATNYSNLLCPYPSFYTFQPNIKYFVSNNVNMFFFEGTNKPISEFSELKCYLLAKLTWNPNLNYDSLMNDFMNGYYGDGGKYVKSCIDAMTRNLVDSRQPLRLGDNPAAHINDYLSPDNMTTYFNLIAQAENATKQSPEILKRVQKIKLYLDYVILEQQRQNKMKSQAMRSINGQDANQTLAEFLNYCKQYGVTSLSEAGMKPDDYQKLFQ